MRTLVDLNVWIGLVMINHPSHEQAVAWFEKLNYSDSVGFCRATQQGFLRLITDQKLFQAAAVSNKQAWQAYKTLRSDPRVMWVDEPEGLEDLWIKHARLSTSSPKVWMDAYLVAMAQLQGLTLVSFDRGFRAYENLDWIDLGAVK